MNLETIQEMWEKDSQIDPDNLHNESLKMEADEKLNAIDVKIKYYDVELKFLEEIIKTISNRSYHINNAIEWHKFQAGF